MAKVNKAFRFRVYPTPSQLARLAAWDDALRFLWNLALEQRLMGQARPNDGSASKGPGRSRKPTIKLRTPRTMVGGAR